MGKQICPIAEVVVSVSGSWEPRIANPKGIGLAVPRMRDVPAAAIAEWVIAIMFKALRS